ncbi:hypothetical protein [Polymorphospora lycopeni]|uniref:Uncharacterized protein n=1 Tax=Polymorphospora lycopeni TaxID=3140240 RepID=A0ABV5CKX6_9ACTN
MSEKTKPLPAATVKAIRKAGLAAEDNDDAVLFFLAGFMVGAVWCPGLGTDLWAAYWRAEPVVRCTSRDAAVQHILDRRDAEQPRVARAGGGR